jgi:hypothetical protein
VSHARVPCKQMRFNGFRLVFRPHVESEVEGGQGLFILALAGIEVWTKANRKSCSRNARSKPSRFREGATTIGLRSVARAPQGEGDPKSRSAFFTLML